jgi:hypothetical protein
MRNRHAAVLSRRIMRAMSLARLSRLSQFVAVGAYLGEGLRSHPPLEGGSKSQSNFGEGRYLLGKPLPEKPSLTLTDFSTLPQGEGKNISDS